MVSIRDRGLKNVYSSLEAASRLNASTTIDATKMMDLLAAVGDSIRKTQAKVLKELTASGVTRPQQLDLVKAGLSATEKKDLTAILDKGTVKMTDEVRKFLEQVIGRAPVDPGDGKLHLVGDQKDGILKGTGKAGETVEVINLSTAPEARLHRDDTFVLATVGADGKFAGRVPDMKEGDVVRMRTRDAAGKTSDWLTVRASGLAPTDTRNSQVAVFRIGLAFNAASGKIDVTNINTGRPVTEPGAKLALVNNRTGDKTVVQMDVEGTFPANLAVAGKKGDVFNIRVTDGKNDTALATQVGTVTVPGGTGGGGGGGVDLPDPKLHKDELNADGTPRFSTKRFTGPLFANGVNPEDVRQGQLGDCYFPSALAALAKSNPDVVKNAIKDNGNGTYTVTFKEYDYRSSRYKDKPITIDADLYVRAWGGPLYGSSGGDTSPEKMELWFPLIEKAYAAWKGSYNEIGSGGLSSDVFEAFLGKSSSDLTVSWSSKDAVWNKIRSSVDAKLPVSAGTFGESQAAKYTNTGVYADHSYSILGYKETVGTRYITIRNPWGESEPFPGDGKNDGIFDLKLDDFMKLYQTVMTVSPH